MRAVLILCCLFAGLTEAAEVGICYNYGCGTQATVTLSDPDLAELDALFQGVDAAFYERAAIGEAIGLLNRIAGKQTPIHNDRAENNDDDVNGRMDCIDHSTTATNYLKFLDARGLLRFHRVLEPLHRAPYLVNDHWGAAIQDKQTRRRYVVDAWFYANGHNADVLPAEQWLAGGGGQ